MANGSSGVGLSSTVWYVTELGFVGLRLPALLDGIPHGDELAPDDDHKARVQNLELDVGILHGFLVLPPLDLVPHGNLLAGLEGDGGVGAVDQEDPVANTDGQGQALALGGVHERRLIEQHANVQVRGTLCLRAGTN